MIKIKFNDDVREELKKSINLVLCEAYSELKYMGIEIPQDYETNTPNYIDVEKENEFIIRNPEGEVFGYYFKYLDILFCGFNEIKRKYPKISIRGKSFIEDKFEGIHVLEFNTNKTSPKFVGDLYVEYPDEDEDEDEF